MIDEPTTVEVAQDDSTENYTVYESADGETIVGLYVEDSAAEQIGEYASVEVEPAGSEDTAATAHKSKDTASYGVYELPPVVTGGYLSHDLLDSDDGEAPESVVLTLHSSSEEAFERSKPEPSDEQVDAILGDTDDDDDDSDESGVAASDDAEEVIVSDEELGLSSAD
jgi:hypothetical protein